MKNSGNGFQRVGDVTIPKKHVAPDESGFEMQRESVPATVSDADRAAIMRYADPKPRHQAPAMPTFPPHVDIFLALLQDPRKFGNVAKFDDQDMLDYGRLANQCTRDELSMVFRHLREKHEFQPKVANVKAAIALVTGRHADPIPAHAADSFKTVQAPKALPSTTTSGARDRARAVLANLPGRKITSPYADGTPPENIPSRFDRDAKQARERRREYLEQSVNEQEGFSDDNNPF